MNKTNALMVLALVLAIAGVINMLLMLGDEKPEQDQDINYSMVGRQVDVSDEVELVEYIGITNLNGDILIVMTAEAIGTEVVGYIKPGQRVGIVGFSFGSYQVVTQDGLIGWVGSGVFSKEP